MATPHRERSGLAAGAYWLLAAALIGFGFLSGFSIGIPFLVLGWTLVCIAPLRGNAKAFWPPIGAVVAFFGAFVLVAPFACTASVSGRPGGPIDEGRTVCRSLIGYSVSPSGAGGFRPSLMPAVLVAIAVSIAVAFATRSLIARLRSEP